jgi:hypothetical protein
MKENSAKKRRGCKVWIPKITIGAKRKLYIYGVVI